MRPERVFPALAALVLGGLVACGEGRTTEVASNRARASLTGAPFDPNDAWSVGVCGSSKTENGVITCSATAGKCTGTLVAPNLVLTARHCVTIIDAVKESRAMQWLGSTVEHTHQRLEGLQGRDAERRQRRRVSRRRHLCLQ